MNVVRIVSIMELIKPKLVAVKTRRKPKPPDTLTKIMKTLEELKKQKPKTIAKTKNKAEDFVKKMSDALSAPTKKHNPQLPISMSDLDKVRQQIRACWNPPPRVLPSGTCGHLCESVTT